MSAIGGKADMLRTYSNVTLLSQSGERLRIAAAQKLVIHDKVHSAQTIGGRRVVE
jgi:hypothetical protein